MLGFNKESDHTVLEYRGDLISPQSRSKFDSSNSLVVPVMPPTLNNACRLLKVHYRLKVIACIFLIRNVTNYWHILHGQSFQVWVEMEKSGDVLEMEFPITIATCPFRIPNSPHQPKIEYG